MTKEEKIAEISKLMVSGVLTAEEFASIVAVLNGASPAPVAQPKSEAEKKYDDFMQNHVLQLYRSPGACKYAPFDNSLIKEGDIEILEGWKYVKHHCRWIQTWTDAQNGYGAYIRSNMILVIDDDFNITMCLQKSKGLLGGEDPKPRYTKVVGVK